MEYQYLLEKGSKKHICPSCGKKRFVRYIDLEKNEYLPSEYGRCDREANCTYHLDPYTDGYALENKTPEDRNYTFQQPIHVPKPSILFPTNIFEKTLKGYEENTFIQNLLTNIPFPFEPDQIEEIISMYYLGTVNKGYRKGAVTFPFIDHKQQVRTIQVKQFNKQNHTTATDFLHSIIERHYQKQQQEIPQWLKAYQENETKVSCLFGEHLLTKYPNNPIALVEAPKTAIYGTLYFGSPNNKENFLWLAVYNLSSLNLKKCKVLQGRKVYLFPDLSKNGYAFDKWSNEAQKLNTQLPNTKFTVSHLLEMYGNKHERLEGQDIADYLIQLDWKSFRHQNTYKTPKTYTKVVVATILQHSNNDLATNQQQFCNDSATENQHQQQISNDIATENQHQQQISNDVATEQQPTKWNINSLESFFSKTKLPQKINMNGTTISNVTQFVNMHLSMLKANNGKSSFLPYLHRLKQLQHFIEVG